MSTSVPVHRIHSWSWLICFVLLFACTTAFTQEGGDSGEQETRQVGGISAKTYEKFAKAQELSEADDYQGALRVLDEIKNQKKLQPAETIQLYNFYGVVYFSMERYKDSIRSFEQMLAQPEVEPRQRNETMYTLAQLHFQIEDWQGAVDLMEKWLKAVPNPPPDPLILLASAYYQLDQYDKMLPPIKRAMQIARERGTDIKESWYLLQRVAYYEQGDIQGVVNVLEILVTKWPKKEYWTMLSGMYGELNQDKKQLAAYQAAYDQGLLTKSAEVVTLAQLLMQAEAGYKAAQIMQKGMDAGIVEGTPENYRLLSQAWQMASEYERAIPPLQEAAKVSDDGELDVRLANSYLNLGRYDECVGATRTALKKGGLDDPANAHEIAGMCLFELAQYDAAKQAFRLAARDKDAEKRARNWIKFIDSEQLRLAQLDDSIEQARAARDAAREQASIEAP